MKENRVRVFQFSVKQISVGCRVQVHYKVEHDLALPVHHTIGRDGTERNRQLLSAVVDFEFRGVNRNACGIEENFAGKIRSDWRESAGEVVGERRKRWKGSVINWRRPGGTLFFNHVCCWPRTTQVDNGLREVQFKLVDVGIDGHARNV